MIDAGRAHILLLNVFPRLLNSTAWNRRRLTHTPSSTLIADDLLRLLCARNFRSAFTEEAATTAVLFIAPHERQEEEILMIK